METKSIPVLSKKSFARFVYLHITGLHVTSLPCPILYCDSPRFGNLQACLTILLQANCIPLMTSKQDFYKPAIVIVVHLLCRPVTGHLFTVMFCCMGGVLFWGKKSQTFTILYAVLLFCMIMLRNF